MAASKGEWQSFFPYEIRPSQKTMVNFIEKLIPRGIHMVIEAANGTGKTIATLAGLLPYARRYKKKIVYMARTHSQIDRVMEELTEISTQTSISGIALRGRQSMCLNKLVLKHARDARGASEMCIQLKAVKKCSYFTNMLIDARIQPILNILKSKPATADLIFEMAESAEICPAETARTMLKHVDVVACSYLYLLDANIRSSFLDQLETDMTDLILVFDEAHNVPDTAIESASDEISTFAFSRAIREAKNENRNDLLPFLESANEFLTRESINMKLHQEQYIDPGVLLEELELDCDIELDDEFFHQIVETGMKIRFKQAKRGKEPRSSLGRIGEFFSNWYESIGRKEYTHTIEKDFFGDNPRKNSYSILRVSSLDPSKILLPLLKEVHSSIHISGTIGDSQAYCELTGVSLLQNMVNILPSPYSPENIKVYITNELSTIYKHRSDQNYHRMAKIMAEVINSTPGNVGVFTPSYHILKKLLENGLDQYASKPIYEVNREMTSGENDELIKNFKGEVDQGGAVLCAVLGGRSSEGTDFKGDLMLSVIVVGIPFAPPTPRVNAKIEYLEANFPTRGRTLGYTIPAMNKASQGAGRAVRSLADRAFILLMDFRYKERRNLTFLPEWMKANMDEIEPNEIDIRQAVTEFYRDH